MDDIIDLIQADPVKHALAARLEIESLRRTLREVRLLLLRREKALADIRDVAERQLA